MLRGADASPDGLAWVSIVGGTVWLRRKRRWPGDVPELSAAACTTTANARRVPGGQRPARAYLDILAPDGTPAASSTRVPPRQRFTWRCTWRVRLRRLRIVGDAPIDPSRARSALVEPFGSWPQGSQCPSRRAQVLQQLARPSSRGCRVGAPWDHLHPRPLCLREMRCSRPYGPEPQRAARPNVWVTAVSRAFAHRRSPATRGCRVLVMTDRRVLRGPFPQAERVFRAHFIAGATTDTGPPTCTPSIRTRSSASAASPATHPGCA